MQECGQHCPFLNRSDPRCSGYFSLDRLQHAYEYCFGQYSGCGLYQEMLNERVGRRLAAGAEGASARFAEWHTLGASSGKQDGTPRLIQLRIPTRVSAARAHANAQPVATGAFVSAPSGL